MQERPFHQFHDEMVRWYDHWLKGNDTGMMDEAPVQIWLQGANVWLAESEFPLRGTEYRMFFLRSRNRLLIDPEPFETSSAPPDGFYQAPLHVTDAAGSVSYRTPPFAEDTTMIGPAALHLHASIDTEDTNWIVTLNDVSPDGRRSALTTGWLKASHRELDEERSEHGSPRHPHTRAEPVPPGEVIEYVIRVYPIANMFRQGHSLELVIKSIEAPSDVSGLLPPDSIHLNSARATTHKIFRDSEFQSRLVLPVVSR
jgi:putative CocE/NonD family hydrolase